MQHSKLFIITLFLALSALVAAASSPEEVLSLKRAALDARMHRRAAVGHGSLKKRQPSPAEVAAKERVHRAQYHPPSRTAPAAPGLDKRQLLGVGTGSNGLGCVTVGGIQVGLGCTGNNNTPRPSQAVCRGGNYDGCSPGANYGTGGSVGGVGGAAGISQCCQTGYTCQKIGPFQQSICLNLPFGRIYDLNKEIDRRSFSTQQEFGDYLAFLRNGGTF